MIYSDLNIETSAIAESDIVADVAAIRTSLFSLFETVKGERLFRPQVGASLITLLFEPVDDTMAFYVRNSLIEIAKYEPRITINESKLRVIADPDGQSYAVTFVYTIPSLNLEDSLKFSFNRRYQ